MDQRLLDHLIDNAIEGIIVTDLEGTIGYVNETALRLLMVPGEDLRGNFIGIVLPPASVTHLLPNLLKLALDGVGFDGEILLEPAANNPILVRLFMEAFPADQPQSVLFRFIDWREVKELVRDLRNTSQLAILGDLTRSMAHEILNPIAAIGGFSRKLTGAIPEGTSERDWLDQVLINVEILESLIRTVERFISLPSPKFEKGNLGRVLELALDEVSPDLDLNGIAVQRTGLAVDDSFFDSGLIQIALKAALINALGRMPDGGSLMISGNIDTSSCRLDIEDTGPALDQDQMEDDLSPIHVLRSFRTDLNLAIARKIIDEHGGMLGLSSAEQGGMRVSISIPLDRRQVPRTRTI